jgi:hypothetical protein
MIVISIKMGSLFSAILNTYQVYTCALSVGLYRFEKYLRLVVTGLGMHASGRRGSDSAPVPLRSSKYAY